MRVASFFSGAGGMDLGFINAGHEVVFAMDFDRHACQSYAKNIGDIRCMDFNNLDPSTIPEADVYIGGSPCQDFSIAGKGAGVEGERGSLINKYVDLIGVKKPKWVLLENVKGLLSKRHRPTFDALIAKLESFGYIVSWKVLNSKDFGVPQNRQRVFIVAGDREFVFPEGVELDKCVADIMDDEVDEKYYLSDKAKIKLKDVKKTKPEGIASTVTAGYYKLGWRGNYIKVNKLGFIGNEGVIKQGGLLNRVYDANGCAPTTITSGGRLIKQERIRRLTPRECARLQGFPEDYIFGAEHKIKIHILGEECGTNVELKNVIKSALLKLNNCASSITKGGKSTGIQISSMSIQNTEKKDNAISVGAINSNMRRRCVSLTITNAACTETQPDLKKRERKELKKEKYTAKHCGKLLKIVLESDLSVAKLSTILIWIEQIILKKICMSVNQGKNTEWFTDHSISLPKSLWKKELSSLEMECTCLTSDTQVYKMVGNAVTVNVAEAIARRMDG